MKSIQIWSVALFAAAFSTTHSTADSIEPTCSTSGCSPSPASSEESPAADSTASCSVSGGDGGCATKTSQWYGGTSEVPAMPT